LCIVSHSMGCVSYFRCLSYVGALLSGQEEGKIQKRVGDIVSDLFQVIDVIICGHELIECPTKSWNEGCP
jgi:hypothetical protein